MRDGVCCHENRKALIVADLFSTSSEIIQYSNKHFYEVALTPLIVNRLRTKPITE